MNSEEKKPLKFDLVNLITLIIINLLAIVGTPVYFIYYSETGITGFEWALFFFMLYLTGLSITAGYHRLWAHKTYEASPIIKFILAIWGACALQNSVFHWASDHRNHHQFVDDLDKDPYSAKRGFFYSHIGWILLRNPHPITDDFSNIKDLKKCPILNFQDKYYVLIAVVTNLVIPPLLGYYFTGSPWGALWFCGIFRLFINHHFTFLINSAAHIWGTQPYSGKDTSRDNLLLSFVTYGEGYHNFHHTFQTDYRNGVRWYNFDVTKWTIFLLSKIGLTSKLKRTSHLVVHTAVAEKQLQDALIVAEKQDKNEDFLVELRKQFDQYMEQLNTMINTKKEWFLAEKDKLSNIEIMNLRQLYLDQKKKFKSAQCDWNRMIAFS